MSQRNNWHDDPRYDSLISLALDQQLLRGTSTDLRAAPSSQPWSSYSIRQDSLTDTESMNETPTSSLYDDDSASAAREYVSKSLVATPRSSSPLATSSASGVVASNVITCGQCGTHFTGSYRRGNLARHVRQKHGHASVKLYTCRAADCLHDFRRQDARLKHERKLHSELEHTPMRPREQSGATSHTPYKAHGERTSLDCLPPDTVQDMIAVHEVVHLGPLIGQDMRMLSNKPTVPQDTLQTFVRLHATLNAEDYSLACDTLCTRWEAVAQGLKAKGSDAYDVFARALAHIYAAISAIDCAMLVETENDCQDYYQSKPTQESARRNRKTARDSVRGCSNGLTFSNQTRLQKGKMRASGGTTIKQDSRTGKPPTRKVECPLRKHRLMYPNDTTFRDCHGCSCETMSQVRHHLKQRHVAEDMIDMIPFLEQCDICKETFLERLHGQSHMAAATCTHRPQDRGNIVTPWARLYLRLHPHATQIPIPYTDEHGFLPPSVVNQCRPRPFLGERSLGNAPAAPHRSTFELPYHQSIYQDVQGLLLAEANRYLPAGDATDLQSDTYEARMPDNESTVYLNELERARLHYLGLVFNARRYMSSDGVLAVVQGFEAFVSILREHHAESISHAAPSMSTQPSDQGINTVFTSMTLSPQTNPTTATDLRPVSPCPPIEDTFARGIPITMGHGQNDLAHVYNPLLSTVEPEVGGDDLGGWLNFDYLEDVQGGELR